MEPSASGRELADGLRIAPLGPDHSEGLRLLRNRPEIRAWFVTSDIVTAEQQGQWLARYERDADDQMWVVLDDSEQVVAAIGLRRTGSLGAEIQRLMVNRSVVRGLGRPLIEWTIDAAGSTSVYLEVKPDNRHAIRLYGAVGFVPVGGAADGLITMVYCPQ